MADTSLWIDHFRGTNESLRQWLTDGSIIHHPFVTAELASGHLKHRDEIIRLLASLPHTKTITQDEYLFFVEHHQLFGRGLGMVDIHLLASAMQSNVRLATLDKALGRAAKALGLHQSC